jgi:hypothetical protein
MTESPGNAAPASRSDLIAAATEVLVRKYLAVWLWSILFGGTTGLTYTMISFQTGERWGALGLSLAVLTFLAIYLLAFAWLQLYKYLRTFLIPHVLIGIPVDEHDAARGGEILGRAYLLMILAGIVGLSTRAAQYLLQAAEPVNKNETVGA